MIWGLHYVSIGLYWLTVSVLKIKCCVGELQQMVKGPLQHYNICKIIRIMTLNTISATMP